MKYFIKFCVAILLAAYLLYVFVMISGRPSQETCQSIDVIMADSAQSGFITPEVATKMLEQSKVNPIGKNMAEISSQDVESLLVRSSFINNVVCYKSPGGRLGIIIEQRLPIMRVMSANGDDYYIDSEGNTMNNSGYSADLVIATGHITKSFASKQLVNLGMFLRYNDFWNNQIEQINVEKDGSIDLVSRVGGQIIHLGNAQHLEQKFSNMMALYEKVIPTVGWNKYSRFNVEHLNQVICTIAKP